MKKPTEKQIASEIAKLTRLRDIVRPFSLFGDNHRSAIFAQIDVLEQRLTEEDVWDRYGESAENICSNAVDAAHWLAGEHDEETLSKGWLSLVQK